MIKGLLVLFTCPELGAMLLLRYLWIHFRHNSVIQSKYRVSRVSREATPKALSKGI